LSISFHNFLLYFSNLFIFNLLFFPISLSFLEERQVK
jgi:hypothetical protein